MDEATGNERHTTGARQPCCSISIVHPACKTVERILTYQAWESCFQPIEASDSMPLVDLAVASKRGRGMQRGCDLTMLVFMVPIATLSLRRIADNNMRPLLHYQ